MRNNRKNSRRIVSWFLGIFFLVLSSFLVFHAFSFSHTSHKLFSEHLKNVIYQQDDVLQQSKTDLLYAFDQLNYSGGFNSLNYRIPSSVGVYVFHKDSLVFWNNNLIEPKLLRKRVDLSTDTIMNLNIGDFLKTSDSKGANSFYLFSLLNTTYPVENKYFVNKVQPMLGNHKVRFSSVPNGEDYPIYSRSGKLLSYCTINFPTAWNSSNLGFLVVCICLCLFFPTFWWLVFLPPYNLIKPLVGYVGNRYSP